MSTVKTSGSNIPGLIGDAFPACGGIALDVLVGEPPLGLALSSLHGDLWFLIDDTIESRMEKKPKGKSAWFLLALVDDLIGREPDAALTPCSAFRSRRCYGLTKMSGGPASRVGT